MNRSFALLLPVLAVIVLWPLQSRALDGVQPSFLVSTCDFDSLAAPLPPGNIHPGLRFHYLVSIGHAGSVNWSDFQISFVVPPWLRIEALGVVGQAGEVTSCGTPVTPQVLPGSGLGCIDFAGNILLTQLAPTAPGTTHQVWLRVQVDPSIAEVDHGWEMDVLVNDTDHGLRNWLYPEQTAVDDTAPFVHGVLSRPFESVTFTEETIEVLPGQQLTVDTFEFVDGCGRTVLRAPTSVLLSPQRPECYSLTSGVGSASITMSSSAEASCFAEDLVVTAVVDGVATANAKILRLQRPQLQLSLQGMTPVALDGAAHQLRGQALLSGVAAGRFHFRWSLRGAALGQLSQQQVEVETTALSQSAAADVDYAAFTPAPGSLVDMSLADQLCVDVAELAFLESQCLTIDYLAPTPQVLLSPSLVEAAEPGTPVFLTAELRHNQIYYRPTPPFRIEIEKTGPGWARFAQPFARAGATDNFAVGTPSATPGQVTEVELVVLRADTEVSRSGPARVAWRGNVGALQPRRLVLFVDNVEWGLGAPLEVDALGEHALRAQVIMEDGRRLDPEQYADGDPALFQVAKSQVEQGATSGGLGTLVGDRFRVGNGAAHGLISVTVADLEVLLDVRVRDLLTSLQWGGTTQDPIHLVRDRPRRLELFGHTTAGRIRQLTAAEYQRTLVSSNPAGTLLLTPASPGLGWSVTGLVLGQATISATLPSRGLQVENPVLVSLGEAAHLVFDPASVNVDLGASQPVSVQLVQDGDTRALRPEDGQLVVAPVAEGAGVGVEVAADRLQVYGRSPGRVQLEVQLQHTDVTVARGQLPVAVGGKLPLEVFALTDRRSYRPGDRLEMRLVVQSRVRLSGALVVGLLDGDDVVFGQALHRSSRCQKQRCSISLQQQQISTEILLAGYIPAAATQGRRLLRVAAALREKGSADGLSALLDRGRGVAGQTEISVVADPAFTKATVVGRVFRDSDGDRVFGPVDRALPNAHLLSDRGHVIVTDGAGRFHLDQLRPGPIAFKVVASSVPYELHQDVKTARVVQLSPGGVVRQDLALQPAATQHGMWQVVALGIRPEPALHMAFQLQMDAGAQAVLGRAKLAGSDGNRMVQVPLLTDGRRRAHLLLIRSGGGTLSALLFDVAAVRDSHGVHAAVAPVETIATITLPANFAPIDRDFGKLQVRKKAGIGLQLLGTNIDSGATQGVVGVDQTVDRLDIRVSLEDGRMAWASLPVATSPLGGTLVALFDSTVGYDFSSGDGGANATAASSGLWRGSSVLGQTRISYIAGWRLRRLSTARLGDAREVLWPAERYELLSFPDPNERPLTFGDRALVRHLNPAQQAVYGGVSARELIWSRDRLLGRLSSERVALGTGVGAFVDSGVGGRLQYQMSAPPALDEPELEIELADVQGEVTSPWEQERPAQEGRAQVTAAQLDPDSAEVFVLANATRHVTDRFVPTAGSFYQLRHTDIVSGSEEVAVERLDPATGAELSRRILQRGRDYELDCFSGRLIFADPIFMSADGGGSTASGADLNQHIVVRYAFRQHGQLDLGSGGGRLAKQLGPIVMQVHAAGQNGGQNYGVGAASLYLKGGRWGSAAVTAAASGGRGADEAFSNDGGIRFETTPQQPAAAAGALGATAHGKVGAVAMRLQSQIRQAGFADAHGQALTDDSRARLEVEADYRSGTRATASYSWLDGSTTAMGRSGQFQQQLARATIAQQLPLGFAASGGAELLSSDDLVRDGQRTSALMRLDHSMAQWLSTYVNGRYALALRGDAYNDSGAVVGARLGRRGDYALVSEVGYGYQGVIGRFGAEFPDPDGAGHIMIQGSQRGQAEVAVGGRKQAGGAQIFGEERRGFGSSVGSSTRLVGTQLAMNRALALVGRYEHSKSNGHNSAVADRLLGLPSGGGRFERQSAFVGLRLSAGKLLGRFELEGRDEKREESKAQFVGLKADASYELKNALFARMRLRQSTATSRSALWRYAPIAQRQLGIGLAYRPADPSLVAGFARFNHIDERIQLAQGEGSAFAESFALALDSPAVGWLGAALGLAGRVAFLDGAGLSRATSFAGLVVPRLDFRPGWLLGVDAVRPLEFSLESSLLFTDGPEPDLGGRVELAWRFTSWLRLGIGYGHDVMALDDLETASSEIEAQGGLLGERGLFFRVQGVY